MNKQIDEIAKRICTYPQCIHYNIIGGCENTECPTVDIAEQLYKAGYHKQAEVAGEIFKKVRNAWAEARTESEFWAIIKELQEEYEDEQTD